ncbi:hypothetical protein BD410DRAFT_498317 [Rickenella mellea]|uniref:Secreted protein n=1 Tax=Rickenella mellea TaxID=50990 RepID=A0A4Y7PTX0_9AGAM|nr:hypothetical protein BD410DRAFT_498317 [Rickenella mellea]
MRLHRCRSALHLRVLVSCVVHCSLSLSGTSIASLIFLIVQRVTRVADFVIRALAITQVGTQQQAINLSCCSERLPWSVFRRDFKFISANNLTAMFRPRSSKAFRKLHHFAEVNIRQDISDANRLAYPIKHLSQLYKPPFTHG